MNTGSKVRTILGALTMFAMATVVTAAGDPPIEPEVLRIREAAWRAWFAGDEKGLREMLPAEFIGINMQDGPFSSLDRSIEQARGYAASGGRLVSLEFPETRAQRYGDVVVLYGRYKVVTESGSAEKKQSTTSGRLTEVFVKRDGRWVHPGWHLDTASTP
jgi:hypothetical protein